jgi:hypothetical protein
LGSFSLRRKPDEEDAFIKNQWNKLIYLLYATTSTAPKISVNFQVSSGIDLTNSNPVDQLVRSFLTLEIGMDARIPIMIVREKRSTASPGRIEVTTSTDLHCYV